MKKVEDERKMGQKEKTKGNMQVKMMLVMSQE